jgi:hypothetical protein
MFEAYSHSNHEGLIAASCIEKEVRFGSLADIDPHDGDVRCTLKSIVAELEHGLLPCDRMEVHRVQKRAVQIEDSGLWQLTVLHGRSELVSHTSRRKRCSSPCAG